MIFTDTKQNFRFELCDRSSLPGTKTYEKFLHIDVRCVTSKIAPIMHSYMKQTGNKIIFVTTLMCAFDWDDLVRREYL